MLVHGVAGLLLVGKYAQVVAVLRYPVIVGGFGLLAILGAALGTF